MLNVKKFFSCNKINLALKILIVFILSSFFISYTLKKGLDSYFTYITPEQREFLFGNFFHLLFDIVLLALMVIMITCVVFENKKYWHLFQHSFKKISLLYAFYVSFSVVLTSSPIVFSTDIDSFDRVIGISTLVNYDVEKRIAGFILLFIVFAISFSVSCLFFNRLIQSVWKEQNEAVFHAITNVVIVANSLILVSCISFYNNFENLNSVFNYSNSLLFLIILSLFSFSVFKLNKNISFESYIKVLIVCFSLAIGLGLLLFKKIFDRKTLLGIQTSLIICSILGLKFVKRNDESRPIKYGLTWFSFFSALLPFATSLYIELIYILNQWNIFVVRLRLVYGLFIVGSALMAISLCLIFCWKKISFKSWKAWTYPCLLFGIACISVQISFSKTYFVHIFETANFSVLISDFLNYGSIPIVEHYGGHMMTDVWEGLIYALLNNDYKGAVLSPYSVYSDALIILFVYFILKNVLGEETAFLSVLTLPIISEFRYFGMGLLCCIATFAYVKKNTYFRAVLLWLSFVWCALYRLDMGVAFFLAIIVAFAIYVIIFKNYQVLKQLILTLCLILVFGIALWVTLCFCKNINPISRLKEFIYISMSNQNWAYNSLGNTNITAFFWVYLLIPIITIFCLMYLIFSKKVRDRAGIALWMVMLVLGLSYVFNFSRSLVRHSLLENVIYISVWSFSLFISLVISFSWKGFCRAVIPLILISAILSSLTLSNNNYTYVSILEGSVDSISQTTKSWNSELWTTLKNENRRVNRVVYPDNINEQVEKYEKITNCLLTDKNETFIDFCNKTFIYSALNRRNPLYISQSPLQLSGEFSQDCFIKQMAGVPLVFIPVFNEGLDGVENNTRYYKILENIYLNYLPLCVYEEDFSVWCVKERYTEFVSKLSDLIFSQKNGDLAQIIHLDKSSCDILYNNYEGYIEWSNIGEDSYIEGVQKLFNIESFISQDVELVIDYSIEGQGTFQLFYKSENEQYSEQKSIRKKIEGTGSVSFCVPQDGVNLRLDIDTNCLSFKILSIKMKTPISYINYGYDLDTENGQNRYRTHSYLYYDLARLWAEKDKKAALNNKVVSKTEIVENGIYLFETTQFDKKLGNYLNISAEMVNKTPSWYKEDDIKGLTVKLGIYIDGVFVEKYRYLINLKEGTHEYLLRISSDYYWYTEEINSICIESLQDVKFLEVKVLEGD